ncbi:TPA: hypothetical protein N6199_003608 [Escherichia coli]|nr:hypothetical protein [Escherichia coli]
MAGLTKEQRAQREAAQKTQIELVVMVTDYQMFPGAPTIILFRRGMVRRFSDNGE